jgi:PPM family protein phosphatase
MPYSIGVTSTRGIGPERGGRQQNEDNYLVSHDGVASYLRDGSPVSEPLQGAGSLVAVCDGMGGHQAGDVASLTAARALTKLHVPEVPPALGRVMLRFVREAHNRIHWLLREKGPVEIGTTLTACWLTYGHAAWVHVGDSRLYLIRDGQAFQLSPDHTRNEFAQRDGKAAVTEGSHLAQSFIYGSRGLGDDTTIRLEYGMDASIERLHPGDHLLLCSDGFSGAVGPNEMVERVQSAPSAQQAANACVERAINGGATDNITVIVVRISKHAKFEAPPDALLIDEEWEEESTILF